MSENNFVNEKKEDCSDIKLFKPHPLLEVSQIVNVENGADIYLAMGQTKYQLSENVSQESGKVEYVFKGKIEKGDEICFVHKDGKTIPIKESENCGYTLKSKARSCFKAENALVAYSDSKDDETYIYINQNSTLFYIGESRVCTLYVRVYDNREGVNNDRWVVLFID